MCAASRRYPTGDGGRNRLREWKFCPALRFWLMLTLARADHRVRAMSDRWFRGIRDQPGMPRAWFEMVRAVPHRDAGGRAERPGIVRIGELDALCRHGDAIGRPCICNAR